MRPDESGMTIHPFLDFIPDRSDDRFLFCTREDCDFFTPIKTPGKLVDHYAATQHQDYAPGEMDAQVVMASSGVMVDDTVVKVKMYRCRQCQTLFPSMSELFLHKKDVHPKSAPDPQGVMDRLKAFVKRLP